MVQNGTLISSPAGACSADRQGPGALPSTSTSNNNNENNVLYQCEQPVSTVVCLRSSLPTTAKGSGSGSGAGSGGGGATDPTPTSPPTVEKSPSQSPTLLSPTTTAPTKVSMTVLLLLYTMINDYQMTVTMIYDCDIRL